MCVTSLCPLQADKRDPQGATVSGFEVLLQKQLKGKQMQKEMAEFIRERWASLSLILTSLLHNTSLSIAFLSVMFRFAH